MTREEIDATEGKEMVERMARMLDCSVDEVYSFFENRPEWVKKWCAYCKQNPFADVCKTLDDVQLRMEAIGEYYRRLEESGIGKMDLPSVLNVVEKIGKWTYDDGAPFPQAIQLGMRDKIATLLTVPSFAAYKTSSSLPGKTTFERVDIEPFATVTKMKDALERRFNDLCEEAMANGWRDLAEAWLSLFEFTADREGCIPIPLRPERCEEMLRRIELTYARVWARLHLPPECDAKASGEQLFDAINQDLATHRRTCRAMQKLSSKASILSAKLDDDYTPVNQRSDANQKVVNAVLDEYYRYLDLPKYQGSAQRNALTDAVTNVTDKIGFGNYSNSLSVRDAVNRELKKREAAYSAYATKQGCQ